MPGAGSPISPSNRPAPSPRELRPLIGNRVYDCDICQEVCPHNAPKFVQITDEQAFWPRAGVHGERLIALPRSGRIACRSRWLTLSLARRLGRYRVGDESEYRSLRRIVSTSRLQNAEARDLMEERTGRSRGNHTWRWSNQVKLLQPEAPSGSPSEQHVRPLEVEPELLRLFQ